jgi:hypothetical protein
MLSSIRHNATRVAYLAFFTQLVATACDPTAPNDPNNQSKLLGAEASQAVGGSGLTASGVSWFEVDLTWPTSPSASGYQIVRSTAGAAGVYTQLATTTSNVGNFADRAVSGSTQYCYEVRSFKTAGKNTTFSAFSSAACATTPAPPPPPILAPTETEAVPQGNKILVKWKDNSANEDGFRVERSEYLTNSWEGFTVPTNSTSTYGGGTPERLWCFRVTAFNAAASSLPSTPDCTVLPAVPTGLSATVSDAESITLSWTDNSSFEDGYKVSRSEQGGPWTDIATLPTNSVGYRDLAVSSDVSYTYRIQPLKDGGYSDVSEVASAAIPTTVPVAPVLREAGYVLAGDTRMFYLGVVWVDASSNEAGFLIQYSPNGETDWSSYADAPANSTSFVEFLGIESDPTAGCFRVVAFNALGNSTPSNVGCADATSIIQQIVNGTNGVTGAKAPTRPISSHRSVRRRVHESIDVPESDRQGRHRFRIWNDGPPEGIDGNTFERFFLEKVR